MTNEEYIREAVTPWQEYIKELSNRSKFEAISEIKEDLKEIKDTLKKMQEDIKLLENNDHFDPPLIPHDPPLIRSKKLK